MLGMMGNKQRRMAMMSSQISAPRGPYGPQPSHRDMGEGNMALRMAAMDLISAVRNDDPERLVNAFKSLSRMCNGNDNRY
jgi:hypothetical protein